MRWSRVLLSLAIAAGVCVLSQPAHLPAAIVFTGNVDPSNPASWNSSTDGYIGKSGEGDVTVDGGSELLCEDIDIGYRESGRGRLTVEGIGSRFTSIDWTVVGWRGIGTVEVRDAGELVTRYATLALHPDSMGTVVIEGPGSNWKNATAINVGHDDEGRIEIKGGATLTADSILMAALSESASAIVTVQGTGSTCTANRMEVGRFGEATLNVLDGGVVMVTHLMDGVRTNSRGTINVQGTGSLLRINDDLYVGDRGSGILNVQDGGAVVVENTTYVAADPGSSGTIRFGPGAATLTTTSLGASPDQLTGTGTVETRGLVSDVDLVFDSMHGLDQTLLWNSLPQQDITIHLDLASNPDANGDLGAGYYGAGSLAIRDGVQVASDDGVLGYRAGSSGTVSVEDVGSMWTVGDALQVGKYGSGSLAITSGGVLQSEIGYLAHEAGSTASVLVAGPGSTWSSAWLTVGRSGTATLHIRDAATVSAWQENWQSHVGDLRGSTGTMIVEGPGSQWISHAEFNVGNHGTGILDIRDAGAVSSSVTYLGRETSSTGTVTVAGAGSTWTNSGDLFVGNKGSGTLNIRDGGSVAVGETTYVAVEPGSAGTVIVDGAGSQWMSHAQFVVGNYGTGTLQVRNSGAVSNSSGYVGDQSGSTGTVTVEGSGATWTNQEDLIVGNEGRGTLQIRNGGAVSNSSGYVGGESGSTGTVIVQGVGSEWTNQGNLRVGRFGSGTLAIRDGGAVNALAGSLGVNPGSSGTAMVEGEGSRWTMERTLSVGGSGSGTLVIRDGGTASSGSWAYVASNPGSSAVVSVEGAATEWDVGEYLHVGLRGSGTLNILGGATVHVVETTYVGSYDGSSGVIRFGPGGGTLRTAGLCASPEQVKGTGTVYAGGLVSDVDLVFDSPGSLTQTLVWNTLPEQNVTIHLDLASDPGANGALGAGYNGHGALAMRNAVQITSWEGWAGYHSGATGTITVEGAGTTWTVRNRLSVGHYGTGTLTVRDGASVTSKYLSVGVRKDGTFNILSGAQLYTGYPVKLGATSGVTGTVNVDGSGSTWLADDSLTIGAASGAVGVLTIRNGGNVTTVRHFASVGSPSGARGTVIVEGAGSTWTVRGDAHISVGHSGAGTLLVRDGGTVMSPAAYLGYESGAVGVATVEGAGSQLIIPDEWAFGPGLYVGYRGDGRLLIRDGGIISNGGLAGVGYETGSTGVATVIGTGSKWDIQGPLRLGTGGTVKVLGGAEVAAESVSIKNEARLTIDAGGGSSLSASTGSATFVNDGTARMIAGAGAPDGCILAPIRAANWQGSGTYQPIGGTWDAMGHVFTVSPTPQVASATPIQMDLAQVQRVLVEDTQTGWALGVSFPASEPPRPIDLAAAPVSGAVIRQLELLLGAVRPPHVLRGAWEVGMEGYEPSDQEPIYLSLDVGPDYKTGDLLFWRYNGTFWQLLLDDSVTYDGQYAALICSGSLPEGLGGLPAGFGSGPAPERYCAYAVSAVPEVSALALLLTAAFGGVVWQWWCGRAK